VQRDSQIERDHEHCIALRDYLKRHACQQAATGNETKYAGKGRGRGYDDSSSTTRPDVPPVV
jgi:hypothetical protein